MECPYCHGTGEMEGSDLHDDMTHCPVCNSYAKTGLWEADCGHAGCQQCIHSVETPQGEWSHCEDCNAEGDYCEECGSNYLYFMVGSEEIINDYNECDQCNAQMCSHCFDYDHNPCPVTGVYRAEGNLVEEVEYYVVTLKHGQSFPNVIWTTKSREDAVDYAEALYSDGNYEWVEVDAPALEEVIWHSTGSHRHSFEATEHGMAEYTIDMSGPYGGRYIGTITEKEEKDAEGVSAKKAKRAAKKEKAKRKREIEEAYQGVNFEYDHEAYDDYRDDLHRAGVCDPDDECKLCGDGHPQGEVLDWDDDRLCENHDCFDTNDKHLCRWAAEDIYGADTYWNPESDYDEGTAGMVGIVGIAALTLFTLAAAKGFASGNNRK